MSEESGGGSPYLFMFGLVVFLGSILLFVADLVRDIDVLRSLAANAGGGALLIAWAASDTLSDPDSEVATVGGAAGTALLLYGLYLLLAGLVVTGTSPAHERLSVGLWYLGLALAAVAVGMYVFPTGTVLDQQDVEDAEDADEGDRSDG